MASAQYFKNKLLEFEAGSFNRLALELFRWQAQEVAAYGQYLQLVGCAPAKVERWQDIPFLPIQFFKSRQISVYRPEAPLVFTSSGTTGSQTSRHHVYDPDFYLQLAQRNFERLYGPLKNVTVLALLPAYLERKGSSLIHMAQHFISLSGDEGSGFFLRDFKALSEVLQSRLKAQKPVLLLGVTFALLDFAEQYPQDLSGAIIMETGGMKGRRKEMVRGEVHTILKRAFQVDSIHSEYGMTELLSQAYSQGAGLFEAPPWLQFSIRQTEDPFSPVRAGKTGGLNVADLANVESCAFIQTQDLGRISRKGKLEIMGRFDQADIRGCNLMVV